MPNTYTCEICSFNTKNISIYKNHLKCKKHLQRLDNINNLFYCVCNKKYLSIASLNNHRRKCQDYQKHKYLVENNDNTQKDTLQEPNTVLEYIDNFELENEELLPMYNIIKLLVERCINKQDEVENKCEKNTIALERIEKRLDKLVDLCQKQFMNKNNKKEETSNETNNKTIITKNLQDGSTQNITLIENNCEIIDIRPEIKEKQIQKHNKQTNSTGTIYLIQEREFIARKLPIYKIGMTTQEPYKRLNSYPKGSSLCIAYRCNNNYTAQIEKYLIEFFSNKYIHRKDIGSEYFQGDELSMINDIVTEINAYSQQYMNKDKVKHE